MPTRNTSLSGRAGNTNPPLSGLRGGQPAKKSKIVSVAAEQDEIMVGCRRLVASVGQHGAVSSWIPSTDTSSALQTYPTKGHEVIVCRRNFRLSPGCFLTVRGLVLPSGPQQKYVLVSNSYAFDGAGGAVRVEAVYDNGVDPPTTSDVELDIPASSQIWNAESTEDGGAWADLQQIQAHLTPLPGIPYLEGTMVELTITYIGSPRIVDLGVYEKATGYFRDTSVDDPEWMMPIAQQGNGPALPFPSEYPIEEKGAADPWYGSKLLAAVAHRQQRELGPILAEWSGWDNTTQGVTATEAAGKSTTSTSFVDLLRTSLASWSSANPGWSVSSGGVAQNFGTSNHLVEMRASDACVPVRCWIWASRTVSGTSTVRFTTERYSICEIQVTSATPQWWSATGHVRCGLGAEDASVLEMFGKASGGGSTLNVKHMLVEYLDL